MTQEELKEKIAAIDRFAATQKKAAFFEYVRTNAKHKIGDVVSDSSQTIRVERIEFVYSRDSDNVSIYYYGTMLTKKGEPRKNGQKCVVWEDRIKEK